MRQDIGKEHDLDKRERFLRINKGNLGKPKDLWKALKPLGLPNKISSCKIRALKINTTVEHDANLVLEGFKNYYSTLADNLVKILPKNPIMALIILTLLFNIMSMWSKVIILIWHLFPKTQFWLF